MSHASAYKTARLTEIQRRYSQHPTRVRREHSGCSLQGEQEAMASVRSGAMRGLTKSGGPNEYEAFLEIILLR